MSLSLWVPLPEPGAPKITMFFILFHYRVNISQIASLLIIVETVAHNEVVGDLHGGVLYVEWHLQLAGFHQERADVQALGIARSQLLQHALHGEARVDDVLNDNHRTTFQVLVNANNFLDLSRRDGALVGCQLHK